MASQTQSQRMQDLDLDLEQVDLDLDLLEFLILQPEQNQDLGLLFKVCNMRPTNRETPGYRKYANQTPLHFNTNQLKNETSIGDMIQCQHCQAMKFRDESKDMCCSNGKLNPEPFPPLPQQLAVLFEGTTDQSV